MVAATGIGSGLDLESLVTGLVNAERSPAENRIASQETRVSAEISGFGLLQSAASGVQGSLNALNNLSTFDAKSVSSSNLSAVGASVTSNASSGSFSVAVSQLAQAQSLASTSFDAIDATVGEGTLSFRFGTTDYTPNDPGPGGTYNGFTLNADRDAGTVTIDSSNNTLAGVRDAINSAAIGVSAAIVNDGSGFRLLLSSAETGASNSIEIQVTDSDLGNTDNLGLSRLSFAAGGANLEQTVAASDAQFNVSGVDITSASNSVSDAVNGLTLELRATTDGDPATVSVSENRGQARAAIEGLVSSYNEFIGVANALTAFDAATGEAGILNGDFTTRGLVSQVRRTVTDAVDGLGGNFSSISEIGILTQADGTLSIDSTRLSQAIDNEFANLQGLFARVGTINDAAIGVSIASTSDAQGDFQVEVTRLATQGTLTGAAVDPGDFPITIGDTNNDLGLVVDGTAVDIILTSGSYANGNALAEEFQTRINGALAQASVSARVAVEFTVGNQINITSTRFGAQSTVEIDSVDGTTASLGLSVGTGTDGLDVAGRIGGVDAEGDGQLLLGATGSAASGVILTVSGGALGDRGALSVTQGVAANLDSLFDGILGSTGSLELRSEGLRGRLETLSGDRATLDRRMEALESRLRAQFNALDSLLASIQSTDAFLSRTLSSIPIPGRSNSGGDG